MATESAAKRQRGYSTRRKSLRRCGMVAICIAKEMHHNDVRGQSLAEFSVAKARRGGSRQWQSKEMPSKGKNPHNPNQKQI